MGVQEREEEGALAREEKRGKHDGRDNAAQRERRPAEEETDGLADSGRGRMEGRLEEREKECRERRLQQE